MKSFWLATTGLVVAVALAGPAYATPINGSDSVIVSVVATNPAVDLLSTLSSGGTVTLSNNFWGSGGSGDFAGLPALPSADPIDNTTLSFAPGGLGAFSFTSALGTFTGSPTITVGSNTFTSQVLGTTGSAASGAETISLYLVGNFTPAGSLGTLESDNMSISLTLNENGITEINPLGSFSAGFTIAAPASAPPPPPPPPPVGVPEPLSVMMLGAGLFGLGAVRRRRR